MAVVAATLLYISFCCNDVVVSFVFSATTAAASLVLAATTVAADDAAAVVTVATFSREDEISPQISLDAADDEDVDEAPFEPKPCIGRRGAGAELLIRMTRNETKHHMTHHTMTWNDLIYS